MISTKMTGERNRSRNNRLAENVKTGATLAKYGCATVGLGAITLFGGFIGGVGVLSLIGQFATQQMTSLSLEVAGGMSVVGLGAAATSATILRRTIFRPDPPVSGELPPQDPDFYGC